MMWFRMHKLFTGVFATIIMLILIIVFSYLKAGGGEFLFSGVQSGLSSIEKPLSYISKDLGDAVHGMFSYKEIQAENEALKKEIEKLSKENLDLKLTAKEYNELKSLSKIFSYKPFENMKSTVAARITALDNSNSYKSFTIDIGSTRGVKKGNIVTDGNGLVGTVIAVGKNWSKVGSILEDNKKMSFFVERNPKLLGIAGGTGKLNLSGYFIDSSAKVLTGDVLVTSGMGRLPEGIRIGKVSSINYDSNTKIKKIKISTSAQFGIMRKVAVHR